MSANPDTRFGAGRPTPIGELAAENLRYIRNTIEAAHAFTTVPGYGCIVMGVMALVAASLDMVPALSSYWMPIWLIAAVAAGTVGLLFMDAKAKRQGLSLRRSVALRFFLTLAPPFLAGGLLTAALLGDVGRDVITGIWLLMYGVGVSACGVFSIPIVLTAGLAFMGLGAAALVAPPAWAPAMLALGFGGVHILLGVIVVRDHGG